MSGWRAASSPRSATAICTLSRSCWPTTSWLHGDGGGRVRAITRPVHGRAKVARMLLSGMRAAEALGGWSLRQVQVNGQPGAMVSDAAGKLIAVMVLDIAGRPHPSGARDRQPGQAAPPRPRDVMKPLVSLPHR